MRTYYTDERGTRGKRALIIASVVAAALFVADIAAHGAVRSLVRAQVGSAWTAVSPAGASGEDAANTAGLQKRIGTLESERNQWLATADENASLKALVHLANSTQGVAARVISPTDTSPFGTFAIDAGAAEGIRTGALVLAPDGFVVGRVAEVDPHTSLVAELFAPHAKMRATLMSSAIELEGRGAGNAYGEVPREASTTPGEVARSGDVGDRPVGIVGAVEPDPGNAFQKVYVRVPDAIQTLRLVYVVP